MVFAIVASEKPEKVLLVKADSREEVEKRLQLVKDERILGSFTNDEVQVLNTSPFAVIST